MDEIFVTRAVLARGPQISENRVAALVSAGTLPTPKTKGHFPLLESVRRYVGMLRSHEHNLQAERAQLTRARVDKEVFLQRVREGQYIEADTVRAVAFRTARATRDGLLLLPDRLAGPLAAEHDQATIHALMAKEIRESLTTLAHSLTPSDVPTV